MNKFALLIVFGLLAFTTADPDPDPIPDPDPVADPDPDPEHLRPNAQAYNPRKSRYQGGPPQQQQQQQPYPPQPFQQQSPYPPPYSPQPQQYPPQQQQYPPPPQQPYPQQPYYPPPQQYPYPPQQQQQQQQQQPPGRRGRVLDAPSNLNAVQQPPQFFTAAPGSQGQPGNGDNTIPGSGQDDKKYNKRYPLTPPVLKFKIGIVADLDKESKVAGQEDGDEFQSILRDGYLYLTQNAEDPSQSNVTVEWNDVATRQIKSKFNYAGRGMELSTLNAFEGKLYSCDHGTGIVFEMPTMGGNETEPVTPFPWVILADGNGTEARGFKCKWATPKDGDLWVGGTGFNTVDENGEIKNKNQKLVKRISPTGEITTIDWNKNYDRIADALEVKHPGYVTHEAVAWSDDLERWMFIPKRISKEAYSEEADAQKGSNAILIADEDFGDIQIGYIGELEPDRGFSGMKFIPGTQDQMVVAMKTKKAENGEESYIMAFDLKGNVLLNETKFADQKYQGIEFL